MHSISSASIEITYKNKKNSAQTLSMNTDAAILKFENVLHVPPMHRMLNII